MLPVLIAYMVWSPSILGLGALVLRAGRSARVHCNAWDLLLVTVLGVAALGLVGSLVNFLVPVGPVIALATLLAGWLLFYLNRRLLAELAKTTWPHYRLAFGPVLVGVLLWTALVARQSWILYDTGLYHLQAVKWITHSRLPLGLANLHGRFGFNTTWFPIAATLETPFLQGRGVFMANGLLYAAYGLAAAAATARVLALDLTLSSIFMSLTSVAWISLASRGGVGSASPDLPVTLLGFLCLCLVLRALEAGRPSERAHLAGTALLVAAFAISVKLSALPLAVAPVLALVGAVRIREDSSVMHARDPLFAAVVLLLPWLLRGFALSGYPLYPCTFGGLRAAWAVPTRQATEEAAWIMSWARQPHLSPGVVLADWSWLPSWLRRIKPMPLFTLAALMLIAGSASWVPGDRRNLAMGSKTLAVPALSLLAGIVFWLLTAPDPRFGEVFIWSLGFLAVAAGVTRLNALQVVSGPKLRAILVCGIALIALHMPALSIDKLLGLRSHQVLFHWPALPTAQIKGYAIEPGVTVFRPASGDQCWDAPLPCTPYLNQDLQVLLDHAGKPSEFRRTGRP